jgi:uncharacterized protein (DUF2235 family)
MDQQLQRTDTKKRLGVFLDGTWNAVGTNTNVWRLKALCANESRDGAQQRTYYDIGVNGFWGGTFGKGLIRNVEEAYSWIIDNYDPGDEIFVFGFSRGAYTARSLTGLIAKYGILKPGSPLGINQVVERYRVGGRTIYKMMEERDLGSIVNPTLEEEWLLKYSMPVPIKLIAVWDTVGALGVPLFSFQGISRRTFSWLDTGLRLSIENAFHAIALDEHRRAFLPTLWTKRIPKDPKEPVASPRPLTSVEQRWFVGAHANVGGGCQSDLLAQVPLKWIMEKASMHGLSFRYEVDIDGNVLSSPISDSYKEFMKGAYSAASNRYYRPIDSPPAEEPSSTHINVNETIDPSVFDRWRHDSTYRPPNLSCWASCKKVRVPDLHHAVRADDLADATS